MTSVCSTEKVGIGLTAPAAKLDVYAASGPVMALRVSSQSPYLTQLYNNTFSITTAAASSWIYNNGDYATGTEGNTSLHFYTNGFNLTKMIILGNGNVGIGTTTPATKLHVVGSIRMVDGNEAAGKVMVSDANGTGSWSTISGLPIVNATPAPVAASGDVYVDPNGGGLIIKDTSGQKWRITVSTTGVLTTTATSN